MESPLLAPSNAAAANKTTTERGWFVRAVVWIWNCVRPKSRECAETIMRLKQLMNQLDFASKNSLFQANGKRLEIQRLLANGNSVSSERHALARTMLQTVHRYEAQAWQWARMREVAESLKIELVSQQQTMSVYNAFAQTNAAMERIAQQVNVDSVDRLMSSIQTQIDEGKSVSEIFATASNATLEQYDQDELEEELTALMNAKTFDASLHPDTAAAATAVNATATATASATIPESAKKEARKKNAVVG